MKPRWFKNHVAYTMAKYGMSMCALGMSEEFKEYGIGVNCLWPQTGKIINQLFFEKVIFLRVWLTFKAPQRQWSAQSYILGPFYSALEKIGPFGIS